MIDAFANVLWHDLTICTEIDDQVKKAVSVDSGQKGTVLLSSIEALGTGTSRCSSLHTSPTAVVDDDWRRWSKTKTSAHFYVCCRFRCLEGLPLGTGTSENFPLRSSPWAVLNHERNVAQKPQLKRCTQCHSPTFAQNAFSSKYTPKSLFGH